jgi:hypothetical protein
MILENEPILDVSFASSPVKENIKIPLSIQSEDKNPVK